MKLFTHTKNQLSSLKEKPFKLEKELQKLFEKNLTDISGLKLVKSEFAIKAQRLDTLAFDNESKAFVIIEYKRERNFSVIDQGVSYLNMMLEYKADFILEYNESTNSNLKRNDVDWSQSKVIFVSPSFTNFQKQASNFKDLPIELWEIKQYEGDIIVINPIKKSKEAPSIKQVQKNDNSEISKLVKEIKVYTEEEHLVGKSDEVIELYETYKNAITYMSADIDIEPKKYYVAFKKNKNIADIVILKSGLKIFINLKIGELDDPKGLARDVSSKGHWGNGDYELMVKDSENLEYIMSLVKQAL